MLRHLWSKSAEPVGATVNLGLFDCKLNIRKKKGSRSSLTQVLKTLNPK
jgi:hypothetical protein